MYKQITRAEAIEMALQGVNNVFVIDIKNEKVEDIHYCKVYDLDLDKIYVTEDKSNED